MKVGQLKAFLKKMPDDADVDVLIENTAQWQFPLNDVAYSLRSNKVILMHEKWNGNTDSQPVGEK